MELQIKRIQAEKGINNLMLADKLGVSPQYAGGLASGKVGASIEKYAEIAQVLGVKLWQLFADPKEYTLTEQDGDNHQASLDNQPEANTTPDLVTIDCKTGETRRYVLIR